MVKRTTKSKKQQPKQQPRRVSRAPTARHSDISHYLGFLNHQHSDVKSLRPPSASARRIARWNSWGRVVATSATSSWETQSLCLVVNPMRFTEGTVFKGSDAGQQRDAAILGNLQDANRLLPGTFGTGFLPSEGYHAPSIGNHFGFRRWTGLTFQIRYLGTALNAGGEITVVHDDTAGGAAGSTPGNMRAHPRARRFALPANGRVTTINVFPSGESTQFTDVPQYNTIGSAWDDSTSPGDSRVYGLSGITSGATEIQYGRADVPLGWNTCLLINPAAAGQNYEITVEVAYEGQLGTVTSGAGEAARVQALPITTAVHADPDASALVDTLTHLHVLKGPNSNKPTHSFDVTVRKAMDTLAPLAKRVALGYATKAVESLGF